MLFHTDVHDVCPRGELLKSRKHGILFGIVVVLNGLDPSDAKEQETYDIPRATNIGRLLTDAVEPAN